MSAKTPSEFEFYGEVVSFMHGYQPIVNLPQRSVFAYESLLRGPQGQSPAQVFDQVPRSLRRSFEQHNREAAISRALAAGLEQCRLSLNFSIDCLLCESGMAEQTLQSLVNSGLCLTNLIVEITEADVIQGVPGLLEAIYYLRTQGATIALDDFGAGYAGLNSLIEINPDIIKLDMFLIRGIESSGPRQATLRALCSLAQDLGIELIAEGVETPSELEFLRSIGIELYQGYLFSRPGLGHLPEISWPE